MVQLTDDLGMAQPSRRDIVVDLVRRVVGSYTLGRIVVPVIDYDCDVTKLDAVLLCRELFEFARENSDQGWRLPRVFSGYNVRAEYGLEKACFESASPYGYFALGTAEQIQKQSATTWDDMRSRIGSGLADGGSGNRKMMLSLWEAAVGQGAHDEVAFAWFSPVRPSTWSYLKICGDRSPFTEPKKDFVSGQECKLSFDATGELGVNLRRWQRSVPRRHCAFTGSFEKSSVRRSIKHLGDWQKRHWTEEGVTPFGPDYEQWISNHTSTGSLTLHGGHQIPCYTDANLMVGRLAPINHGYSSYGRILNMALDWDSGCVTAIQLNAIEFGDFLRLTPGARAMFRHVLGL